MESGSRGMGFARSTFSEAVQNISEGTMLVRVRFCLQGVEWRIKQPVYFTTTENHI